MLCLLVFYFIFLNSFFLIHIFKAYFYRIKHKKLHNASFDFFFIIPFKIYIRISSVSLLLLMCVAWCGWRANMFFSIFCIVSVVLVLLWWCYSGIFLLKHSTCIKTSDNLCLRIIFFIFIAIFILKCWASHACLLYFIFKKGKKWSLDGIYNKIPVKDSYKITKISKNKRLTLKVTYL